MFFFNFGRKCQVFKNFGHFLDTCGIFVNLKMIKPFVLRKQFSDEEFSFIKGLSLVRLAV